MSDLADSDNQILYLGQGGLGIGDRDYYVEAENAAIKEGKRRSNCSKNAINQVRLNWLRCMAEDGSGKPIW